MVLVINKKNISEINPPEGSATNEDLGRRTGGGGGIMPMAQQYDTM